MGDITLTPDQIAAGRKAAQAEYDAKKAEYEAKMAYYAAAENLHRVLGGATAKPSIDNSDIENLAASMATFALLDTLKDQVLLALYQGCSAPSTIVGVMRNAGVVREEYPASYISPKLAGYREDGLVRLGNEGWRITDAGKARLFAAIASKKGSDHAA